MPSDQEISEYITETFTNLQVEVSAEKTWFSYRPTPQNKGLWSHMRFAAMVTADEPYYNGKVSNLARPGVFRLDLAISKASYLSLLKAPPHYEYSNGVLASGYDYTALDTIMPHPFYGRSYWICVLSPSHETYEHLKPLFVESHALAIRNLYIKTPFQKRLDSYAQHFACHACRKSFNKHLSDLVKRDFQYHPPCPDCGQPMLRESTSFKPPRRANLKGWRTLRHLKT